MACKETWHNSLRYGKKTHQGFTTFQELHLLIYQRHQTEPGCNAAFQFPWPHHKNRAFKSSAFAPESAMPSLQFLRATQNSPFDPRTVQRPLLCWPGRRRSTPKRSLAAPSSAGMDAARCRPAPSFGSWPLGATLVPPKRLGRLGASGGAVATAAARAICCRANQRRLVLKWFVAFTARSRLISLGAAARLDLLETNDPPLSAASCSAENRVLGCSQGAPAKGGGFPSTFVLGDSTKATTLLALGCAGTVQDSFKPVVNSPCFSHPADLSPGAGTKVGGGGSILLSAALTAVLETSPPARGEGSKCRQQYLRLAALKLRATLAYGVTHEHFPTDTIQGKWKIFFFFSSPHEMHAHRYSSFYWQFHTHTHKCWLSEIKIRIVLLQPGRP